MEAFERAFRERPLQAPPRGVYVGRHRGFLHTEGGQRLDVRVLDTLLFVWPVWGIDFDRCLWWFGDRRLAAGRFRVERGPSRWRQTEVYQLHYDVSRLPVRGLLYDELKTLDDDRAIGIGGTNHPQGRGDHFFFELNRT